MGFEARAVLVDRAARRAERHGGISERATERDHGATGPKTAERSRRTGIVTGVHGIFRSVAADERKEKEYVEQGPSHVDSLRPPKTELRGAERTTAHSRKTVKTKPTAAPSTPSGGAFMAEDLHTRDDGQRSSCTLPLHPEGRSP